MMGNVHNLHAPSIEVVLWGGEENRLTTPGSTVPKKMNSKRPIPRHIIIKMPKVKYNERLLKAAREKQLVTYKGAPIRLAADFSKETAEQKGLAQNIGCDENSRTTTKNTLSKKAITKN